MAASLAGHVPTIEKLLAAGAPVDPVDSKGRLALGYAVSLRQMAAVSALLARQPVLPDAAHGGNDLAQAALETGDRDLTEDILRRLPGSLAWTPAARSTFEKALASHDTLMAPLLMEKFAGPPAAADHLEPLLAYAIASHDTARTCARFSTSAPTRIPSSTNRATRISRTGSARVTFTITWISRASMC